MALVPEGRQVFAPLTVLDNLRMGAYSLRGSKNGEAEADLERVLAIFPKLADRLKQQAGTLSGGEQQRVAIARAVSNAPGLLLADEPTGNLDPQTANHVFGTLTSLIKASGLAALIATHNMELASRMDRRVTLHEGKVVELD